MENVVNAPHVIKSCLPIAMISSNLVGFGVKVHHVSGLFGGLRAGIHFDTDIRLRQCRSVVGAIRLWQQSSTPVSRAMAAAVSGLSPVIITVLIPSRQGGRKAERRREMQSADRDYRRGGAQPGTRAERQGLLDQRRQLRERCRLWQVDAHRWLVRVGHRVHPCAGADSMGELKTRRAGVSASPHESRDSNSIFVLRVTQIRTGQIPSQPEVENRVR
jgi:hypothetical protein